MKKSIEQLCNETMRVVEKVKASLIENKKGLSIVNIKREAQELCNIDKDIELSSFFVKFLRFIESNKISGVINEPIYRNKELIELFYILRSKVFILEDTITVAENFIVIALYLYGKITRPNLARESFICDPFANFCKLFPKGFDVDSQLEVSNKIEMKPMEMEQDVFHRIAESAKLGFLESIFQLGKCYFSGFGVNQNYSYANSLWFLAALLGHDEAQFYLGNSFKMGIGVAKNSERALDWFKKAGKQGLFAASDEVGQYYYRDEEGELDPIKASCWWSKSWEECEKEPDFSFGKFYSYEKINKFDFTFAFSYLLNSANSDQGLWKLELGCLYYKGLGTRKDYIKAVELFTKSSQENIPDAFFYLGECYQEGHGVKKNAQLSFDYYKKGAELGDNKCQNRLANCYGLGNGTEVDIDKQLKWHFTAAENGNGDSQFFLGKLYYLGEILLLNRDEAFKWLTKSVFNGNLDALVYLASCYKYGIGTDIDQSKKIGLLLKSAKMGNVQSMYDIAECYNYTEEVANEPKWAGYWWRKAATRGCFDAYSRLGSLYESNCDIKKDLRKSFSYYLKGAEKGHHWCQYKVGLCYKEGKGTEMDYEAATKWFETSSKEISQSVVELGWMQFYGLGTPVNYLEAINLWKKAFYLDQLEQPDCFAYIGFCYEKGLGVPRDFLTAKKYYNRAYSSGSYLVFDYEDRMEESIINKIGTTKEFRKSLF